MKKVFSIMSFIILMGAIIGGSTLVGAADLGLVQLLTKNLSVTEKQASGGAGAIFNVAKQNMTTNDFTSLTKAVPDINNMMEAAPKAKETTGLLGKASSLFGSSSSKASGVASLAGSFSQLGMKAGMVSAFTPIILNYVKEKGGEPLMNALQTALK
jgi:Protein of unknown function VcgC/VcgE (DUF2780)